jgi:predicted permease
MWLPLVANPRLKADPQVQWVALLARLRPGLTLDAAQNEIDALFRQLQSQKASNGSPFFGNEIRGITLASGATGWTPALRDQFTSQLVILVAMAGFVLLVACANVSSLLLARGGARRRELTIRLAMGSDRSRLVRQLFTESVVLALAGGVLGLSVAHWGTRLLLVYMSSEAGSGLNASLDTRALVFTLGLSFLSAVVMGLIPAIRATRLDLTPALNNKETVSKGHSRRSVFQHALITFQVALSLILLVSAGLFVRTLHNLRTFDVGFERERVHRFAIDPGPGFTPAHRLELHKQVRTRLENLTGIRSVSISTCGLLDPCRSTGVMNNIPGHIFNRGEDRSLDRLDVGARFFETVGMPLLLGRDFTDADEWSGKGPRVGVINERMASRYFPGINPVGHHMQFDGLAPENDVEIIGVAKDSKYRSLREETIPVLYLPFSTAAQPRSFIVRTQGDMPDLANVVRGVLRDVDPRLMLGRFQGTATNEVQSMGEIADASILRERLVAQLASFFGLAALFLVCIGLFGLVSYTVKRRTKEIGIRMAVGARRRDVIVLFARQMFPVLGIGVVAGLAGTLLLGGLVSNLLFGVEPTDARTITGASLLLIAASIAAAYLPLRRAFRVDPTIALRHE